MFAKSLLASLAIAAVATPALSDQFYIVRDATTSQCTIAQRPPAEGAGVVVGDGAYGDRNSAETDMKTIHACISQAAAQTGADPNAAPDPYHMVNSLDSAARRPQARRADRRGN